MTKSEKICEKLGNLYFFKELVKSNLVYITDKYEENELADVLMRVDNHILVIQIKEKEINSLNSIENWLKNKVYKVAKNQIKFSAKEITKKITFKENKNVDILDDIDNCDIVPIIIFDVGNQNVMYNKYCRSESLNIEINVFNIIDFEIVCKQLIAPMEIIRYLKERINYSTKNITMYSENGKNVIVKNVSESSIIDFYKEIHNLEYTDKNIDKLAIFNNYLNLFDEHCISNKEQYKIFIKYLSSLYAKEIYCFIDRINLIKQTSLSNKIYFNSYMISNKHHILFLSLPQKKFDVNFINFISNIFMYYFNVRNVLSIICHSIDSKNYELDFALIEYDSNNEEYYNELDNKGEIENIWEISENPNQYNVI